MSVAKERARIRGNRTERIPTKPLSIPVTEDHIELGVPSSCASCAVTLACRDALGPDVKATITGYQILEVEYGSQRDGEFERYELASGTRRRIRHFDDTQGQLLPFQMGANPLPDRLRHREPGKSSGKGGPDKRRRQYPSMGSDRRQRPTYGTPPPESA